jgi:integrase
MGSRRGPREGSVYRRQSDNRWVGAVSVGYRDGKRVRRFVYASTRRELRERMSALLAASHQGLPVASDKQTVETFLAGWLATTRSSVRPRTHESYTDMVRLHLLPTLGHQRLMTLAPQHVQALLDAKLAEGLSPRTVQYLHAILRRALGQAVRWGVVPRNVAALVSPPRVSRRELPVLTPDEARHLLEHIRDDRLEALYTVALALGLRQGEALGLQWEDVDLETGTLRVRHTLQRVDGAPRLMEPKSAQSRRTIAMPSVAVRALREHRTRQLQERLWAGSRWQKSDFVFTSTIGTPLYSRPTTQRFQRILAAAGLPRVTFHSLRHACASFLLAQGVSPRVVMETLGHSQFSTTMDIYAHVMPAMQRDAAERMDALLAAPAG